MKKRHVCSMVIYSFRFHYSFLQNFFSKDFFAFSLKNVSCQISTKIVPSTHLLSNFFGKLFQNSFTYFQKSSWPLSRGLLIAPGPSKKEKKGTIYEFKKGKRKSDICKNVCRSWFFFFFTDFLTNINSLINYQNIFCGFL